MKPSRLAFVGIALSVAFVSPPSARADKDLAGGVEWLWKHSLGKKPAAEPGDAQYVTPDPEEADEPSVAAPPPPPPGVMPPPAAPGQAQAPVQRATGGMRPSA